MKKQNEKITATDKTEAWNKAHEIFPYDYLRDDEASANAGYDVYRATAEGKFYYYINDLNDRLEVCMDGKTLNIWIEPERYTMDEIRAFIKERKNKLEVAQSIDEVLFNFRDTELGARLREIVANSIRNTKRELAALGL